MRLGTYPCRIKPGNARRHAVRKNADRRERHRHRFEFNHKFRKLIEGQGLKVSGEYVEKHLAEIVELPSHPFFLAVQFHPEFKSRPTRPHPLFRGLDSPLALDFKSQHSRETVPAPVPV